jgi:trans-aconitate methyltransferase
MVDIWTTDYLRVLPFSSDFIHPIMSFAADVGLSSILNILGSAEGLDYDEVVGYLKTDLFLQEFERLLLEHYPTVNNEDPQTLKSTLFHDDRFFMVAQK